MFDSTENSYDFEVEMQPLIHNDLEVTGKKALVRTDTGETLGIHGSRYHPVTHSTVINTIMDGIAESNLTKDYESSFHIYDGGRKLKAEIKFPDLTVQPSIGDITCFRVTATNSYDGTWSFSQSADGLRLFCLNGQTLAEAISRTVSKHTANIDVSGSARKIIKTYESFQGNEQIWKDYQSIKIDAWDAEYFLKNTILKKHTYTTDKLYNKKGLENIMKIWSEEAANLGYNKWALYNSLTNWATHTCGSSSPHNLALQRNAIITKAMNSSQWEIIA